MPGLRHARSDPPHCPQPFPVEFRHATSPLKDIAEFQGIQDGGRPGTHGNCTASSKIDYILLSPSLFQKLTAAGIERRGMWGGKNGTLWPHFPEVDMEMHAGSDHAALWAEISV